MEKSLLIKTNVKAPNFNEHDIFGTPINLEKFKGYKVFLGFYRHVGCPFCNIRIHQLLKEQEYYKSKGLEMIFFFESSRDTILSSKYHKKIKFYPIIADPTGEIYSDYGIERSRAKSSISHIKSFFQTVIKAKANKLPVHWMKDNESFDTIPAEFLIDEYGFVRKIHYCEGLGDQMSKDIINNFLEND